MKTRKSSRPRRYKFQVLRNAKTREFYIHIRARNGEIIVPGEGFKRRRSARNLFENLTDAFVYGQVDYEELDAKGKPKPEPKYFGTMVTSAPKPRRK